MKFISTHFLVTRTKTVEVKVNAIGISNGTFGIYEFAPRIIRVVHLNTGIVLHLLPSKKAAEEFVKLITPLARWKSLNKKSIKRAYWSKKWTTITPEMDEIKKRIRCKYL